MPRFFPPPSGEERILRENQQNEMNEDTVRRWATPSRAADISARSNILESSGPGDAPAVIGSELAGMAISDIIAMRETKDSMWQARSAAGETYDDDTTNDQFNLSRSPGKLGTEALQWWQRTPGNFLGNDMPVVSSAPVKGVSRWFMMAFDAGVDGVSDRVIRSGANAVQEVGHHDPSDISSWSKLAREFGIEYATGEDIGNKEFWGAIAEAWQGNRVNLGPGYMANSDLAENTQAELGHAQEVNSQNAAAQEARFAENPEAWKVQNPNFASPFEMNTKGSTANLNQTFLGSQNDPETQMQQAALGRPITQGSELKQEAFGIMATNPFTGRQNYSQVSAGRIGALMVSEPGTTGYQWGSGFGDLTKQLFADPTNYIAVGAVGKSAKTVRAVNVTSDAARRVEDTARIAQDISVLAKGDEAADLVGAFARTKKAVAKTDLDIDTLLEMEPEQASWLLDRRARKTINAGEANQWLTGEQAQGMVTAFADTTKVSEVYTLLSKTKGRISNHLYAELVDAKTESEVIDALLPHLQEMGGLQGTLNRSAGLATYSMKDMIAHPINTLYGYVDGAVLQVQDEMWGALGKTFDPSDPLRSVARRAKMRYEAGHTWWGRAFNDASNTAIRTDNMDTGFQQFVRLIRNFGLKGDTVIATTDAGTIIQGSSRTEVLSQAKALGENIKGSVKSVDDNLYDFARLNDGNSAGAFDTVSSFMDAAEMKMVADGIEPQFARAVTRLMDDAGEGRLFNTNAIGETSKYPGSGYMTNIDGMVSGMPSPQLIDEMYQGNINIPDYSLVRRTLAEKPNQVLRAITDGKVNVGVRRRINFHTTNKKQLDISFGDGTNPIKWKLRGDLEERAAMTVARWGINNIWKPAKLLRFGYIPKIVVGDEQARMMASGLSTMFAPSRISKGDSPLAYFNYLFARKRGVTDIAGNQIQAADEFIRATSLRSNAYGEVGAMSSNHWGKALKGSDEYVDGLATEWKQLSGDPIAKKLLDKDLGDNPIQGTKDWLVNGEGRVHLDYLADKIGEQNPYLGELFREGGEYLDNYLGSVNGRAHLKTGGDYVWVDPNSGILMGSDDLPYAGPKLDIDTSNGGIFITRRGDDELIEGLYHGRVGEDGVKMRVESPNDYVALRRYAREKVDSTEAAFMRNESAIRLPEGVKAESKTYGKIDDKKLFGRLLDTAMDWTISKPAVKLNREPAYQQFYWTRLGEQLPFMTDEAAKTVRQMAKKAKVLGRVDEAARRTAKANPDVGRTLDNIDDISAFAHAYAGENVKDLLFDFAERKNFFDAISLISPFADAWLEAFTSYGRLFAQDPRIIRRPMKALKELRSNDPTEWGEGEFDSDQGFFHENDYGEEVFSIPFSGDMTEAVNQKFFDGNLPEMDFEVGLESMNMIAGQFYPTAGPSFTIPAAGLIPKSPEYKWLRDFVAPFGLEDSWQDAVSKEIFHASPSFARVMNGLSEGKFESGDEERMFEQTRGLIFRDMITSGEITMADLNDPNKNGDIQAEISKRATQTYLIRAAAQFFSPAAPGAPKMIADPSKLGDLPDDQAIAAIALQDAASMYYEILEETGDENEAMLEFQKLYGFDPLVTLVSMTEKNYQRAVTEEGYNAEQNNPEIFKAFPATAYYLFPDDPEDPFFYEAWSGQLSGDARESKPLEEQIDEYRYRKSALQYSNAKDQLDTMLAQGEIDKGQHKAALQDFKGQLINQNTQYAIEEGTYSAELQKEKLSELRSWSQLDELEGNPTVNGVGLLFESWDTLYALQLERKIGTNTNASNPFARTSAAAPKDLDNPDESTSYMKRAAINRSLLQYGDELAALEGYGTFVDVWEGVIRPMIFDYDADLASRRTMRDTGEEPSEPDPWEDFSG